MWTSMFISKLELCDKIWLTWVIWTKNTLLGRLSQSSNHQDTKKQTSMVVWKLNVWAKLQREYKRGKEPPTETPGPSLVSNYHGLLKLTRRWLSFGEEGFSMIMYDLYSFVFVEIAKDWRLLHDCHKSLAQLSAILCPVERKACPVRTRHKKYHLSTGDSIKQRRHVTQQGTKIQILRRGCTWALDSYWSLLVATSFKCPNVLQIMGHPNMNWN